MQDPVGRLVFANRRALELIGSDSAEELLATPPAELMARFTVYDDEGRELSPLELPGRRALLGEATPGRPLRFRVNATGEERWSVVRATPVFDAAGRVRMAVNVFHDVTEERRAQARVELLAEAGRLLADGSAREALGAVAGLVAPAVAEWCVVDLVDEAGALRRAAVAHRDPEAVAVAWRLAELLGGEPAVAVGPGHVVRTGRTQVVGDVTDEVLAASAQDPEALALARSLGLRATVTVPLRAQDRVLGALTLAWTRPVPELEPEVELAEELARRISAALGAELLHRGARETAALLDTLFGSAPVGLAFFDRDLRFVRVNRALAEMNGVPAEDHVGRTVEELLPNLDSTIASDFRRVAGTGEALLDRPISGSTPAGGSKPREWLGSYYPVRDERGSVLGFGAVVTEVTERRRAEQRQTVQYAAARVLAEAATVAEARGGVLAAICETFGFEIGEVWHPEGDALVRAEAWYAPDLDAGEFERLGRELRLEPARGIVGRVWTSRQPEWLLDLLDDRTGVRTKVAYDAGMRSAFAFPLLLRGEVQAVLVFLTRARRAEDEELAPLMVALGSQLAQFVERRRAEDDRRKLEAVTEAALAHLGLDDLLAVLLQRIQELLDADTVSLLLREGDELVVRASLGLEGGVEPKVRIPIGRGIGGRVAATGEGVLIDDIAGMEVWTPTLRERVRSLIVVPLVEGGVVVGVAHAGSAQRARFGEDDKRLLQLVADRIALAIVQSRLYEAEREARAEAEAAQVRLRFLAEASTVLASSLDYEATLERVAQLAVPWLADRCRVHMLEPDGAIRRLASAHTDLDRGRPERLEEEHLVPRVLESGESELVPQIGDELLRRAGFTSQIAVPMTVRGRTVGAITLLTAESGRRYGLADLAVAEDLARRAAVAVDNALLFRAAEERGRAARVLAAVADGVFLLDREGRIRYWNPAAAAITGLGEAEAVGRPASEAIPGWDAVAPLVPVADAPGPLEQPAETVPLDLGGREVWISIVGVGLDEGTVYAFRDLTAERALEQMRHDFVATVSHELRTPLAAIYGAAMTLRRTGVALSEDQRESLLDVVAGESDRLARIVNDVLWAARLDADSVQVTIASCDAAALARTVVEAARTHLPPRIELELDAPAGLSPVAADGDKVRQVLANLVDNAIKYSPDGGRVRLALREQGGTVRFAVVDSGLGIPASQQKRIFEKFYRLDPNLTRGVGGTGLGLYISRELVQRMHGRIWVESRAGEGSTFVVELPVAT